MASRKGKKRTTPATTAAPSSETPTSSAKHERREKAREARRVGKQQQWMIVGVLVITFIVYWNSLDGQFVYDDQLQILRNPTIKSLGNIPTMFTQSVWQFMNLADKQATGPYYRPFFNIALILNYNFFGFQVVGWHLFLVAIHLLVTLLIYLLAREWQLSREVAAAAALLFGVHPVHSESVAWIAALPDPLAGVFVVAGLLFYEKYYSKPERKPFWLGLCILAVFCAMLCKEVAIVFPVFFLVRELLSRAEGETFVAVGRRAVIRFAPFVVVIALYTGLRYSVLGFFNQDEPTSVGIPFAHVLLTIPSILLAYARMFFIPYPLAVMYNHTYVQSAGDVRFWGAALALLLLVGATLWMIRRSVTGQRAFVLMLLFIAPVLNLKAFRAYESLLHDRYLYLPSIGFCLLAAMGLGWIAARFGERERDVLIGATAVISLLLFGLTIRQNATWQSEVAMTQNAMQVTPEWPFLYNYTGAYYFQQSNYERAEQYYQEALRINPRYFDSLSNLGDVYRLQGRLNEAVQTYQQAIDAGSPYADTYYNLAVVYTSQGRIAETEAPLLKALEISPAHAKAAYNLGWSYDRQGKLAEAEKAYGQALQTDPAYAEPRINLSSVLIRQNRFKEALDNLLFVQRNAPDHPIMLYWLGDVYMKTNKTQEAIDTFTKLAAREPNHPLLHTSLGLCYEKLGNLERAKFHFQKAIEVAPQEPYTNTAREHLAKLG